MHGCAHTKLSHNFYRFAIVGLVVCAVFSYMTERSLLDNQKALEARLDSVQSEVSKLQLCNYHLSRCVFFLLRALNHARPCDAPPPRPLIIDEDRLRVS